MTVTKEVFTRSPLEQKVWCAVGVWGRPRVSQRRSKRAENVGENLSCGFCGREHVAQDEQVGVWLWGTGAAPRCLIPG